MHLAWGTVFHVLEECKPGQGGSRTLLVGLSWCGGAKPLILVAVRR
jgi:hypothetical protein